MEVCLSCESESVRACEGWVAIILLAALTSIRGGNDDVLVVVEQQATSPVCLPGSMRSALRLVGWLVGWCFVWFSNRRSFGRLLAFLRLRACVPACLRAVCLIDFTGVCGAVLQQ